MKTAIEKGICPYTPNKLLLPKVGKAYASPDFLNPSQMLLAMGDLEGTIDKITGLFS